jgi:hypothetical protein
MPWLRWLVANLLPGFTWPVGGHSLKTQPYLIAMNDLKSTVQLPSCSVYPILRNNTVCKIGRIIDNCEFTFFKIIQNKKL